MYCFALNNIRLLLVSLVKYLKGNIYFYYYEIMYMYVQSNTKVPKDETELYSNPCLQSPADLIFARNPPLELIFNL